MSRPWRLETKIEAGRPLLLEASAGTGKTWQIAALFARLVVEGGVPVERILTMTFTRAATGELRDRIRKRLVEVRQMLAEGAVAEGDVLLQQLWHEDARERAERERRVGAALASFDQAMITTIHGFSQQMLERFAFESGLEPGLEVIDVKERLLQEAVDDAVSWSFVALSEDELGVLRGFGWDAGGLMRVAEALTAAVAPELSPAGLVPEVAAEVGMRARLELMLPWVREGIAERDALRRYWGSDAARVALDALVDQRKTSGLYAKTPQEGWIRSAFQKVGVWLGETPLIKDFDATLAEQVAKYFPGERLDEGTPEAAEWRRQAFAPLLTRLHEFRTWRRAWQDRVSPLAHFVAGFRRLIQHKLAKLKSISFDSMLSMLADAIHAEGPDGPLAQRLRERFEVALVDEFQDTDLAQWRVLEAVFARGATAKRRLVLIGDPKQAIYAFRGADVFVYLAAAAAAHEDDRYTMNTNWRSDAALVAALNHLWRFGLNGSPTRNGPVDAPIAYRRVDAHHAGWRLAGAPDVVASDATPRARRPLELRPFNRDAQGEWAVYDKNKTQRAIVRDIVNEVHLLVAAGARVPAEDSERPIHYGDFAVLVSTHAEAGLVAGALGRVGIPSVMGGAFDVFGSEAALYLQRWLEAVVDGGRGPSARILAVTPLFGWDAVALGAALDEAGDRSVWEGWCAAIAGWSRAIERGFLGAFETSLAAHGAWARLLAHPGGERIASDLRQLAELAEAHAQANRLGPPELLAWLRAECAAADAERPTADESRGRRLETDRRAVHIETIHASKGLEYPIVFLPFLWSNRSASGVPPFVWHDLAAPTVPLLELSAKESLSARSAAARQAHEAGLEQERLLYVALTRARHHAIVWLGDAAKTQLEDSALGRLVLGDAAFDEASADSADDPASAVEPPRKKSSSADRDAARADRLLSCLETLAATAPHDPLPTIGISLAAPFAATRAATTATPPRVFTTNPLNSPKSLPYQAPPLSFTALASALHVDDDEPDRDPLPDLAVASASPPPPLPALAPSFLVPSLPDVAPALPAPSLLDPLDPPSSLEALRGGKDVGIWIHALFEHLDFQTGLAHDLRPAPALIAALAPRVAPMNLPETQDLVAAALTRWLKSPIGGGHNLSFLQESFVLSDISTNDQLHELRFDLRIGADPSPGALDLALRAALTLRASDATWLGASWLRAILAPAAFASPRANATLLTGSIDLVFRAPDGRYFLADYKTNRIRPPTAATSTRRHYTPPWLAWEMARHAYHLQALLYTLALHRFLQQRLPDYDYDRHIGGHRYLFLRGMEGPSASPTPPGVFIDRWPRDVVLTLDRTLGGHP